MASLEDLERNSCKDLVIDDAEWEEVEDETGEDLLIIQDVIDSMGLLKQCATFLSYLSDKDICASVTVRERVNMARFAETIKEHLDDLVERYENED